MPGAKQNQEKKKMGQQNNDKEDEKIIKMLMVLVDVEFNRVLHEYGLKNICDLPKGKMDISCKRIGGKGFFNATWTETKQ